MKNIANTWKIWSKSEPSNSKILSGLAAIGATAGMVGHDIRNPLQAIVSDVYLAKSELKSLPDSEEKKAILESLVEAEKNVDYNQQNFAGLARLCETA